MHFSHRFRRFLFAGALCVAVTTASAQAPTVTLARSNYNGYGISCFGLKNGSIDATVTGGTTPYTYLWSNGATTQDLTALAAGYYKITVTDAALQVVTAEIMLTEPLTVKTVPTAYKYPNGYNVSCYECYNGSITVTVNGGVTPYAYLWSDAATTKDRTSLGAGNFTLKVTDNNGCVHWSALVPLTQPERKDWTMNGNAGTTPGTQFLGTTDAQDVVFKSNGTERLRLTSQGNVRLPELQFDSGYRLLAADSTGAVKLLRPTLGRACPSEIPWFECGNNIASAEQFVGTLNERPLAFRTHDVERMRISPDGRVGIGTAPPTGVPSDYLLFVENGIATRDVLVKLGTWPDYVFEENYRLMPLAELREFVQRNSHLPGIPSAAELEAKGGLVLGDIARDLTRTLEEQALYILQLEERTRMQEERLNAMEQRLNTLETSK